jgi:hypothetical protein
LTRFIPEEFSGKRDICISFFNTDVTGMNLEFLGQNDEKLQD